MAESKRVNFEQDIKAIIAEVLEAEPESIDPDAKFVDDLGMDSMMALEILAAIEKKFRIAIPEDALPKFTSFNETLRLVKEISSKKK